MNNKILSAVLVVGIATTGFAGLSAANSGALNFGNKAEIQELREKVQSGGELTVDEQATLDAAKSMRGEKGHTGFGKRKGGKNLTDEEKIALESMSDEEKQSFFEAKKTEMIAQKDAHKAIIDTLIAGETLTADQEATRLEMIAKMAEHDGDYKKPGAAIIAKVLAGDELTADEQTQLSEMKEKYEERQAQRAILKPIRDKVDAGEELTDEEQQILDDHKANKSQGKGKGGRKGRGERR